MKTSAIVDYNFLVESHDITSGLSSEDGSELLMDDDESENDLDIEDCDDSLEGLEGQDEVEIEAPIETPAEATQAPDVQVVSLDDVMAMIEQLMAQPSVAETNVPPATVETQDNLVSSKDAPLEGGEEALKRAFFQGEGNETLDSDFNALQDNINQLETHIDGSQSYVNVTGATVKSTGPQGTTAPQTVASQLGTDGMNVSDAPSIESAIDPELDYTDPRRLIQGLPNSAGFDEDEQEDMLLDVAAPEEEQLNEDDTEEEIEYPEGANPDIYRFGGMNGVEADDTEDVMLGQDEFEPEVVEPMGTPITMNKSTSIAGQTVQIMLTGVIITAPELNYIGESVKNAGIKLKSISGRDNALSIMVEAEGSNYTINYVDLPRIKTKTPFSINKKQFRSLEEALDRINYKTAERESEVFGSLMNENLSNRSINEFKESDILGKTNNTGTHVASWTVHPVGMVNLKTGMNEIYSNVTQLNVDSTTLMINEAGEYYMFIGDLKERSKIGTIRSLTEQTGTKDYGVAKVIGIYENSIKGLGQMMYDIKRTAVPLLTWK